MMMMMMKTVLENWKTSSLLCKKYHTEANLVEQSAIEVRTTIVVEPKKHQPSPVRTLGAKHCLSHNGKALETPTNTVVDQPQTKTKDQRFFEADESKSIHTDSRHRKKNTVPKRSTKSGQMQGPNQKGSVVGIACSLG